MIGLVTDSNSQITDQLRSRYAVEVVPLTITIDGEEFEEGVNLDADRFYGFFDGHTPEVSTSQPSPGAFIAAYQRLVAAGATEIASVHIGSAMSGTCGVATLAAQSVAVPVRVIDTQSASFGVAACVWSAGETIARGGNIDDVERRVLTLAKNIGSAFMVGVPLLINRGGRAGNVTVDDAAGIPIMVLRDGKLDVVDHVSTVEDTVDVMAAYATGWGTGVTVAVGTADAPSTRLAKSLSAALAESPNITEVVQYRIGPSVGAHTGPGTFGLVVFPSVSR